MLKTEIMIHNLARNNSLINQFVAEIRDEEIQKDPLRFRTNMERIGEIFAYEISKTLEYEEMETVTPLGIAQTKRLLQQPVIATILRAGLPLHTGMLRYFDKGENAFISAYRKHHKNNSFEIALEYIACPDITGKTLILCDPMLASGSSIVLSCKALLAKGMPSHMHIVSAIASVEGIEYVRKNMPAINYTLWCAAIDEELTAQAYIVPGLGDAGDLAFGSKL
jgi:uracil phosphoribosyltransferase